MATNLGGRKFFPKMPVDQGRKIFLLVLCRREGVGPHVARTYVDEKVRQIWGCATADEVYHLLDEPGQRKFDDLAWADGFQR